MKKMIDCIFCKGKANAVRDFAKFPPTLTFVCQFCGKTFTLEDKEKKIPTYENRLILIEKILLQILEEIRKLKE